MAYKYRIPLSRLEGVDRPLYSPNSRGDVLYMLVSSTYLEIVQTEASPHFHKDSVNVQVEEVNKEEYI